MYEDEHLELDYEDRNGDPDIKDGMYDSDNWDEEEETDEDLEPMTEEDRTYEVRYFEQHSTNQSN